MINYSNTSKLLFSQTVKTDVINLKSKTSQGTSDTDFKSVFDKNLNETSKNTYTRKASQEDNRVSQNSDSNVKYKSFNDVQREKDVTSRQRAIEKPAGEMEAKDVDSKARELVNTPEEYDESINVLAQMLGLQPSELVSLAKDLGFSLENMNDVNKLSLFMDKLASVLELNNEQKTMLNTLAAEVAKQVGTEPSIEMVSNTEGPQAVNALEEAGANSVLRAIDISKLTDEVKAKLNQLIQNSTVNTESVSSEISKVIEVMRAQIKSKANANVEQAAISSTTDSSTEVLTNLEQLSKEGNVTKEKASEKDINSKEVDNSKGSETGNAKIEVDTRSMNPSLNNDLNQELNQQNGQVLGDVKVSTINNQAEIKKSEFTMPQTVKSSEVVTQVVEQARVVIGQDKSEMVIQLKPDHLGKLELKVVTEQGIVAAKFIAESQAVKEIIETNMQLLKDSLQKQGIVIDSVNVQVGHDKQSEYQKQASYQSNNNTSNRSQYGNSEAGVQAVGNNAFNTLPDRLAQYSYETNTINLTA